MLTLATYAISFAKYFQSLLPSVNFTLIAVLILTLCYVVNMFGVKSAASAEGFLVVVKVIAVFVFILWGVSKIQWDTLAVTGMLPSGLGGFLTATGLVSFATGGASIVAELGGERKNPKRDIPLTIILTTASIAVIYAFMAAVASGVLLIGQVAGKHLDEVAKAILPQPLFLFFIIVGSLFAIASTLNATLSWVTKGFLIACDDGWLHGFLLMKEIPATGLYFSIGFIAFAALYVWIVGGTPRMKNRKMSGFEDERPINVGPIHDHKIGVNQ